MTTRGGAAWTGLAIAAVVGVATASCDAVLGIKAYGPGDASVDGAPLDTTDGGASSSSRTSGSNSGSSSRRSSGSDTGSTGDSSSRASTSSGETRRSSSTKSGKSSTGVGTSTGTSTGTSSSGSASTASSTSTISTVAVPDAGSGCVIGGNAQADGAANPANACQSCQPSADRFDWSNVTDGTSCGTGGICHTGACVSGCEVGGVYYTTDAPDPSNPCQTCQPATSTSAFTAVMDGTTCGNGQVCATGECGTNCDIGGMVYASGTTNPANPCETCQPGSSATAWTDTDGANAGCAAGEVCNGTPASCVAGCVIDGAYVASAGPNPSDPCESCNPTGAGGTTAWTDADGLNAGCPAGDVCTGIPAACAAGCFLGGSFDPPGVTASDGCEVCDPASSVSAWTDVDGAASCPAGEVCQSGACVAGCFIAGAFFSPAEVNPGNECQTCQPAATDVAWSDDDGASCGGGGGVCSGGLCHCTLVVTSSLDETVSYASTLTVTYSMIGGGGGASDGAATGTGGGGGGSSAVLVQGMPVAYAAGGAGGSTTTLGTAGSVATGTFTLTNGDELTLYVGGGGGGGFGLQGAGGAEGAGGAGYFGGGGAGGGAGGAGGTNVGGAGGSANGHTGATGTAGDGGNCAPPAASKGGVQGTGGAPGPAGGGGGGGYGGGGGGDSTAGGSNGAPVTPATDCGFGALTWATATTLPPAAGAGGAVAETGGNAGLVILTYTATTCSL